MDFTGLHPWGPVCSDFWLDLAIGVSLQEVDRRGEQAGMCELLRCLPGGFLLIGFVLINTVFFFFSQGDLLST